jgi:hypothetical protein
MNDGGNAFPFVSHGGFHEHQVCEGGMTLRDYFAAAALQGWISSCPTVSGDALNGSAEHADLVTVRCYRYADAMLKQREKGV